MTAAFSKNLDNEGKPQNPVNLKLDAANARRTLGLDPRGRLSFRSMFSFKKKMSFDSINKVKKNENRAYTD